MLERDWIIFQLNMLGYSEEYLQSINAKELETLYKEKVLGDGQDG